VSLKIARFIDAEWLEWFPVNVDETKLRQLMDTFLAENRKLNLSALRTPELCWPGNILDSVAFLQSFDAYRELTTMKSLVDIGTGGGFPLLPLALCLPEVRCTGMDATQKKIDAVQRIIDAVGIPNASLICGRIESIAHNAEHREQFDVAMARAVAPLSVLLEYAVPLLRVGGLCAFWKSTKIAAELAETADAQKKLAAPYLGTFTYQLPDQWGERTIVFFRKTASTHKDYPRRTGIPKNDPL
jgi:16S rRNA (guanine527-N7)-methyltransferase